MRSLHTIKNRVAAIPAIMPENAYDYCCKDETRKPDGWDYTLGAFLPPNEVMSSKAVARESQKKQAQLDTIELFKEVIRNSDSREEAQNECFNIDFNTCKSHFEAVWTFVVNETRIKRKKQKRDKMESKRPNDWQAAMLEVLKQDADPRKVEVVLDYVGDTGKSFFVDLAQKEFPGLVVECRFGKAADMGHVIMKAIENNLNREPRVLIIDCARFMVDKANLAVIEDIKNGRVNAPKYDSDFYTFTNVPHVVVCTNSPLQWDQMSEDRWRIWKVVPSPDEMLKEVDDPTRKLWKDCTYEIRTLKAQKARSPGRSEWRDPNSGLPEPHMRELHRRNLFASQGTPQSPPEQQNRVTISQFLNNF